jgi:hypothetical protein
MVDGYLHSKRFGLFGWLTVVTQSGQEKPPFIFEMIGPGGCYIDNGEWDFVDLGPNTYAPSLCGSKERFVDAMAHCGMPFRRVGERVADWVYDLYLSKYGIDLLAGNPPEVKTQLLKLST